MTGDDRFERDLMAIVRERAPEVAPPAVRVRVDAALRATATRQRARRLPLVAAAVATIGLLVAVSIGAPWLGRRTPGVEQTSGASPTDAAIGSPMAPTPATTLPVLAEPVTNPGQVQIGNLLTANAGWVFNTDGHLFLTHSSGAAWREATPSGLDPSQPFLPTFLDWEHGWVAQLDRQGGRDLRVWRTTNSGQTWSASVIGGAQLVEGGLAFLDPMDGYLTTDPGGQDPKPELRWTHDGGATWSDPIDLAKATGIQTLQVVDFFDQQAGVMTGDGVLLRTDDGGQTWTDPQARDLHSFPGRPRYGPVHIVSATTGFDVVVWLDGTGKEQRRTVIESQDAGASWATVATDDLHREWGFVDAVDWIGTNGTQVWSTSDDGRTFDVAPSIGLPVVLDRAYLDFVDTMHGWAQASGGVPCKGYGCLRVFELFKTDDGGRSWSLVGACTPGSTVEFPCPSPRPG